MSAPELSRSEHLEVKNKVNFYLNVHRFDAAEKLLKAMISRYGDNSSFINLLGVIYHRQSKFADAIKQFKLALKINPNFVEASLNLSSTLCDLSKYDEAKEVYTSLKDTVHQTLKLPQLLVGRLANQHAENGKVYAQAGLVQEAVNEFRKALDLFPKLPDVRLHLARLYFADDILDRAKFELEQLILHSPRLTEAYNLLGLVHFKAGREDLAKTEWQKAAQLDPDDLTSRLLIKVAKSWS